MLNGSANVLVMLRAGAQIEDPKLAALAKFTKVMLQTHGKPTQQDFKFFLAVGYVGRRSLEIILALAVETLSNFANHLFHTQLDHAFTAYRLKEAA